jgi:ubiquitin thioesterase OTU1
LNEALQLAKELKSKKEFTDLTSFTLQCGICFEGFKGMTEAEAHATKTTHMNFMEIKK